MGPKTYRGVNEGKLAEIERRLLEASRKYAEKAGYALNPDERVVKAVIRGLALNELRYGKPYCPCRRITGDLDRDSLIICPCAYHKEEIERLGRCHCGLFVKR